MDYEEGTDRVGDDLQALREKVAEALEIVDGLLDAPVE